MTITRSVAPTIQPVTLQAVKDHLRETSDTHNARLDVLIPVATSWVEARTGRALITQTWILYRDHFWGTEQLTLPKAPLQAVTGITYVDANGATQTLGSSVYRVLTYSGDEAAQGTVELAYDQEWPDVRDQSNAVAVTFRCGYGTTVSTIPAGLQLAIYLRIEQMFLGQTDDALLTSLINHYRVEWGF